MKKLLVVYFSASGVTKKVAQELIKTVKTDSFEITPATPYTAADLDWRDPQSRSTLEMKDPDCRPPIVGKVEDLAQYDIIFLGFPIWWNREPSVVDTFLDAYDFSGKKLIPFCTSGGSGFGDTVKRLQELVGPAAVVEEGTRLGGTVSEADLVAWTAGLGL